MTRRRLDAELVRRGLAPSREAAAEVVATGRVLVRGSVTTKPSTQVSPADPVAVTSPARPFASRGGEKLAPVLDRLGIEVAGRRCLDAGASTGGFTDVLLQRGAAEVHAVDVGYGLLAGRLRNDPKVRVHDRTNARALEPEQLGGPVDLTVADLSFISLVLVLPALTRCTAAGGDLLPLVKPQFEVGREAVGKGVVRDPGDWAAAIRRVATRAVELGAGVAGLCASPRPGPAGNVEFFLHLRAGRRAGLGPDLHPELLDRALAEGLELAEAGKARP